MPHEYYNVVKLEGRAVDSFAQWLSSLGLVSNATFSPTHRFLYRGLEFDSIAHYK